MIFDIETDGLKLDAIPSVWCICCISSSGERLRFGPTRIDEALVFSPPPIGSWDTISPLRSPGPRADARFPYRGGRRLARPLPARLQRSLGEPDRHGRHSSRRGDRGSVSRRASTPTSPGSRRRCSTIACGTARSSRNSWSTSAPQTEQTSGRSRARLRCSPATRGAARIHAGRGGDHGSARSSIDVSSDTRSSWTGLPAGDDRDRRPRILTPTHDQRPALRVRVPEVSHQDRARGLAEGAQDQTAQTSGSSRDRRSSKTVRFNACPPIQVIRGLRSLGWEPEAETSPARSARARSSSSERTPGRTPDRGISRLREAPLVYRAVALARSRRQALPPFLGNQAATGRSSCKCPNIQQIPTAKKRKSGLRVLVPTAGGAERSSARKTDICSSVAI